MSRVRYGSWRAVEQRVQCGREFGLKIRRGTDVHVADDAFAIDNHCAGNCVDAEQATQATVLIESDAQNPTVVN